MVSHFSSVFHGAYDKRSIPLERPLGHRIGLAAFRLQKPLRVGFQVLLGSRGPEEDLRIRESGCDWTSIFT